MRESKGVAPLCHIVEGDLTSIISEENPHQLKRGLQEEGSHWGSKSPIFFPILAGHCPEYIFGGAKFTSIFLHTESSQILVVHLALSLTSTSQ